MEALPADYAERQQALDITHSFIVQAPAGSGKTELLTQRYLALLANVQTPEEIIAVTFTRKAAAEMRLRILEALQAAAESASPPAAAYAKARWELARAVLIQNEKKQWNLLENPNRLRIQTIDSFCASLTRQMPLLSRFGAQPAILEDSYSLYREAANTLLMGLESNTPWADTLATLLLHLDNDHRKVEELLSNMLARRDQWLSYIVGSTQHQSLRKVLEKGLQRAVTDTLYKLSCSVPADLALELLTIANFAGEQIKRLKPDSIIIHCEKFSFKNDYANLLKRLQQNPELLEQEKNLWLGIAELLLTKEGEWRKSLTKREGFIAVADAIGPEEKKLFGEMKNRAQALLAKLAAYDELKQNLQAVRLLPPCSYTTSQWEVLTSLLALLPILVAELQLLFQEHEAVDYLEVAQSALLALGDAQAPTDLALRLDYQIKHLLVDEFQDTSTTQFRLLEQLTAGWQPDDGRTLFLVGDPMQSIYRFRKAEVGLFLQACESGIGNIPLKPLTLAVNFRATPPLVNWVNNTFQTLMPPHLDIGSGAVSFSCSLANKASQEHGEVLTHGLLLEDESQEALAITRLIQETWQNNSQQRIAILVRARTHLLEILPALQESNIPYRAIEIDTLAERPIIQDLLALTRALLHPADRIAWLAVLRAPWCGLTLMELQTLVGMELTTTLWDRLINVDYAAFSSPAKENLQRVITILQQSLKDRRRQSLATWIYGTWLALGGPASLTAKTDLEDAKVFFQLLDKLQKGEDIADLAQLEKQLSLLYAAPQLTNDNYVEVMTIHKAKGLEFDVVILPGLDRLLPADAQQLLLCMERPSSFGDTDLLLAPIKASAEDQDPIYNYLRHEEKTRANYETVRLLYVAVTRAKHSLHLVANLTPDLVTGVKKKQPNKNSLLAQLWPSLAEHFLTNIREQDPHAFANDKISYSSHKLRRPTAAWQLPKLPSGLTPKFVTEDSKTREKNNYYHWNNNPERHVGTVVHQLLQTGLAHWDKTTVIEKQDYFRALLTHLGVESAALPNCMAQVTRALQNILDDERGRWILAPHQEAQSEFALTMTDGDEVQQMIIDRTFIDEAGIRWIIDYKTSAAADTMPLEGFLNHEVARYRTQLEEYARIMQKIDTNRPIRLGLYFPLLKAWREWDYG